MDRRVHLLGERVHGRKVVHLDNDKEMVYIEVVVHESSCVRMEVVLCMVHLALDNGSECFVLVGGGGCICELRSL